MSQKLAVIAHRDKVSTRAAGVLRACLADVGFEKVSWTSIDRGRAATPAARRAVEKGASRVLVAGGDGTVRAAIQALAGTGVPLAVFPAGTANLFAGALGLPTAPTDVAAAVRSGVTRSIDTARCNEYTFAVMAGTGLDAMMIDDADDAKDRLGTLAYVRAGIHAARHREPFHARVRVDGEDVFEGDATCVLVGNMGELKAGVSAFPDARPDDGLLDVAVVTARGVREWGSVMISAVRQRQSVSGHAHLVQGTTVDVRLDEKHRLEVDGGSKGRAKRLRFTIDPGSLEVCTG